MSWPGLTLGPALDSTLANVRLCVQASECARRVVVHERGSEACDEGAAHLWTLGPIGAVGGQPDRQAVRV